MRSSVNVCNLVEPYPRAQYSPLKGERLREAYATTPLPGPSYVRGPITPVMPLNECWAWVLEIGRRMPPTIELLSRDELDVRALPRLPLALDSPDWDALYGEPAATPKWPPCKRRRTWTVRDVKRRAESVSTTATTATLNAASASDRSSAGA